MEKFDMEKIYDAGKGTPCLGSVTTLVYDTKRKKKLSHHLSLVGTLANCGVAPTPWNTAIICEESFETHAKNHGYAFEVPVGVKPEIIKPEPLKAMGRFKREGVAVDPNTGIIYQTEDQVDGLLYRFIPKNPQNLSGGGRLQCLAVVDKPRFDTRNWRVQKFPPGEVFDIHWIDLENADTDNDDLRQRGLSLGAALFAGGEGIFQHGDSIYFSCTNGGIEAKGQIWIYTPSPYEGTEREGESTGKLELFVEPNDPKVLDHPDQLTVAPFGDVFVCEDGDDEQYMIGITPERKLYKFARNALNHSELSGVCFSPDETTMFVNILASGLTFAITGPWVQS
jgi:secreted PhoX family phosphatase